MGVQRPPVGPVTSLPVTLDAVPPGTTVVLGVPDLPPARARRLAEFGLRAGQRVTVLHRTAGGGRLLAVGDARVAVDVGLLHHVPASPAPGPDEGQA